MQLGCKALNCIDLLEESSFRIILEAIYSKAIHRSDDSSGIVIASSVPSAASRLRIRISSGLPLLSDGQFADPAYHSHVWQAVVRDVLADEWQMRDTMERALGLCPGPNLN